MRQATQISSAIISRQRRDTASRRMFSETAKAPSPIFSMRAPEWRTLNEERGGSINSLAVFDSLRITDDSR